MKWIGSLAYVIDSAKSYQHKSIEITELNKQTITSK